MEGIILPSLAKRLKPLRKARKLTQKQMAELMGYAEQHYQRIEYGKINIPATSLMFLANFFNVSADYLLGRKDEKN